MLVRLLNLNDRLRYFNSLNNLLNVLMSILANYVQSITVT